MTTMKTNDEEMLAVEASFMELSRRFIENGISPFVSAAVMTKLAFMIYKTSLNNEEYNLMIDSISDNRDRIKSFEEYGNIGRLN